MALCVALSGCVEERQVGVLDPCPDCPQEPHPPVAVCGNGVAQVTEVCDGDDLRGRTCESLGLPGQGLRCTAVCELDLTPCQESRCGDGVLQGTEECDDGNVEAGDGCGPTCRREECGNGVLDPGEVCDDGNVLDFDGCPATCLPTSACGDGVLDPVLGEACDDGNARSHDGCSSGCTEEQLSWEALTPSASPGGTEAGVLLWDAIEGRILRVGGGSQDAVELWEFDGVGWVLHPVDSAPPPRRRFAVVQDRARERLLLFGGEHLGQLYGDTWQFDGAAWSLVATDGAPGPRAGHRMVQDLERDRVVLFGGENDQGRLGDTWEFDGDVWSIGAAGAGPSPRSDPGMSYDRARHVTVVFGGLGAAGPLGDTWTYDGEQWTSLSAPALPPPTPALQPVARSHAALACSLELDGLLLFGGVGALGQDLQDLWRFDGQSWVPLASTPSPGARSDAALAYDPVRRELVLYGGLSGGTALKDTWTFSYRSAWPDEACDNGVDDDNDGRVDCADPDCVGLPCAEGRCVAGQCL